jgi:casein kinase II subunit beta
MSDESNSRADDGVAMDGQGGWISWFCSLDGHEYLVEVDESYIKDPFNLHGLHKAFPQISKDKFKHLVSMILSPTCPNEEDLADEAFLELNSEASDLYGLIHARYINSACGLAKVY